MSQGESRSSDLDRLDLGEVKRFVARRWPVVLVSAIACVVLAAVACVATTPVYTATTQVLLDPRKQHVFGQDAVTPDSALDSSIVDSQVPIILSTRLLAKVANREHLVDDPEFSGPITRGLLDRLFSAFRLKHQATLEPPSFEGIDPKLQPVILRLLDKIDVTRLAKSYVIAISVSSRDAAKAMRLSNSLANIYVEDQVDVRAKSVQQTAAFFEQRLGSLRDQVRQSEQAVANYRKAHNLTTTTMEGKITVGEQQLQNLNEQLALASTDTAEKHARYEQGAQFKLEGTNVDTLPEVIKSPVVTQLRGQQADLTRRAADLSAMYGPAYPAIVQIRAQQAGLAKAIGAEMKRLVVTLKNEYEVAKAREDSLRKTIGGLTEISGGDNDVGVKLRELERTNLANKALFENFLNRAKLTQEQSTFEEPDARIISPALEPTAPSSPKTKLILPVAFVAGLILGLGVAAALDMVHRGPRMPAAASQDAFILARIPQIASRRRQGVDCLDYIDAHPMSPFAQAVDALCERILPKSGDSKVVMLAPLGNGEGATSLARCVAAICARAPRRVLLIDADFARRGLSAALGASARPGFGEVVTGSISATKAAVQQGALTVLPAGQTALDAAKDAKRLRAFFAEARQRFDLVILDAGVFDAGEGALALAATTDGFALVTSWDHLMRETFIAAVDAVGAQPNFLGIILNRADGGAEADLALAS